MKKILEYGLGLLCWLNASICYAAAKFETLPDLPDPLAYAVQPAEASTVSHKTDAASSILGSQTVGHEPNIVSVIFSLLIVVVLIYVTGIIYAKLNRIGVGTIRKQHGEFSKSQVAVISTTPLGNNKTLHVVELDGKRMLIGASAGAIQLIKDLGSVTAGEIPEEYSHIEIPNIKIPKIEIPKIEIPSIGFSKLVTKTHNELESDDNTDSSDEEAVTEKIEEPVSFNTESNTPDEIIDSLFTPQEIAQQATENSIKSEHMVDPDEYALYKKYLS